ncbi:hypothetical protein TgHK011_008591 [Trichoderma gracile]|nr:hypothetical protein TgHK011_008591 [Trichoderma gracile]
MGENGHPKQASRSEVEESSLCVKMRKLPRPSVVSSRTHRPGHLEALAEQAREAEPAHDPKRNLYNKRPSPSGLVAASHMDFWSLDLEVKGLRRELISWCWPDRTNLRPFWCWREVI